MNLHLFIEREKEIQKSHQKEWKSLSGVFMTRFAKDGIYLFSDLV